MESRSVLGGDGMTSGEVSGGIGGDEGDDEWSRDDGRRWSIYLLVLRIGWATNGASICLLVCLSGETVSGGDGCLYTWRITHYCSTDPIPHAKIDTTDIVIGTAIRGFP